MHCAAQLLRAPPLHFIKNLPFSGISFLPVRSGNRQRRARVVAMMMMMAMQLRSIWSEPTNDPLSSDSMRLLWYTTALDEQERGLIHEQAKRQKPICAGRRPQVPRPEQHQTQGNDDQTLRL